MGGRVLLGWFFVKSWPTSHIKHYGHYSQETWQNGNLLHGSSDHSILIDLHPRSHSQGLIEKLGKLKKQTNTDIFSNSMTTTAMKLGTLVLCGKALQIIPVWVTFLRDHSHRDWWKIWKNSNIDIFYNSMASITMKVGTVVLYDEALQTIPVSVTFIQGHRLRGWLKILKHSNIIIF